MKLVDLQGPVRQAVGGQDRNGMAALRTQETQNRELVRSGRLRVAVVPAVTMKPALTASGAVGPITFEAVSANLDAPLQNRI